LGDITFPLEKILPFRCYKGKEYETRDQRIGVRGQGKNKYGIVGTQESQKLAR
jgi:hypothetical protein